jgi:osmoprotectant transport system ATP-binding protein
MSSALASETVIAFRNVSYRLDQQRQLLHQLNLEVRRGETLVLLGRSGSGKTTTLKLMNRLLVPSQGEVRVENRPTTEWDPIRLRRHIGYVIQEVGLFPHFTVERNIALVPNVEGWPPERIDDRVRELLELVGLGPEFRSRYPRELSGGQRQRVGVARALAADPPILLMDEPFGALDPITRAEIQNEFQALKQRLNKTIVFVTHDLREGLLLGTRIGLFEDGRLVGVYTHEEFLRSTEPLVAAYLAAFRTAEAEHAPSSLDSARDDPEREPNGSPRPLPDSGTPWRLNVGERAG